MLQVDETLDALFLSQKSFLTDLPPGELNNVDYNNFEKDGHVIKSNVLNGNGLHPVLDYLNLGLTMPVQYSPQASLVAEHSQVYNEFMQSKA